MWCRRLSGTVEVEAIVESSAPSRVLGPPGCALLEN